MISHGNTNHRLLEEQTRTMSSYDLQDFDGE
jgi:hypothetical protein